MYTKIALIGNPNSGKTTLFNNLTGSSAHVGNWPGVTVEKKTGKYKSKEKRLECEIVDLPGIYSLSPYTPEEVISRDFITSGEADVVINIVDASNLERNLYLSTQLLEMDIPVVIAVNMMDMIEKSGNTIDIPALEKELGVPIVGISASQSRGTKELVEAAIAASKTKRSGNVAFENPDLLAVTNKIADIFVKNNVPHPLYYAVKYIDNDESAKEKIVLDDESKKAVEQLYHELEGKFESIESEIADSRYQYISKHCSIHTSKAHKTDDESISDKIDKVLTSKTFGIPLFLLIMFTIFHLTFTENFLFFTNLPGPGKFFETLLVGFVESLTMRMEVVLIAAGASDWALSLVVNGIFAGVGAVLGFLPLIMVLYFCISVLEDSGYMARAAFIMDRVLRKFGLSGKSFVPMIMGFGCSVPAITATRTLENEKDRRLTIMLIPFMSCGAKIPIYALIVPVFFPNHTEFVVTFIYLLGIVVAICAGIILKKTVFEGNVSPFIMELPPYRLPSAKSLAIHLWGKFKGFATKVGTIITVATIVIWFLSNFGFSHGFGMVEQNSAESILGVLGNAVKFVFVPLGFAGGESGWKMVVAVLSGIIAKEAVVTTMGQLLPSAALVAVGAETSHAALLATIAATISIPAALSFIAWNLLSVPCMAAVGAISAEMNSKKWLWRTIAFHLATAWLVSFIVFHLSSLFF